MQVALNFASHSSYLFLGNNVLLETCKISISMKKNLWNFVHGFDEAEV